VVALRNRISATADPAIALDEVRITVKLADGRVIEHHVPHAIGSVTRPMTDANLETKFHALTDEVLGVGRVNHLLELCWGLERLDAVSTIAKAACPEPSP
jgi:2-methylcitrate dehydratase PrpD